MTTSKTRKWDPFFPTISNEISEYLDFFVYKISHQVGRYDGVARAELPGLRADPSTRTPPDPPQRAP